MKTQPINPQHADRTPAHESSDLARIAAEIAERAQEMREIAGPVKAGIFFQRLGAICTDDPRAFWLVTRLLTGDLDAITLSYTVMAKDGDNRSKQSVQQEIEVLLAKIQKRLPELAVAIERLRCVKAEWRGVVAEEF